MAAKATRKSGSCSHNADTGTPISKLRTAPPPKAVTIPKMYTPSKSYSSSIATIAPLMAKAIVPMMLNTSHVIRAVPFRAVFLYHCRGKSGGKSIIFLERTSRPTVGFGIMNVENMFAARERKGDAMSREQAILVGCQLAGVDDERFRYSMEELASLVATANGEVVAEVTQKREAPHPATYIGKGKTEELAALVKELEPDLVVFNSELSPSQARNLTNLLGEVKVIDRTQLILDIFAQRARSKEGKLQVELAQLEYMLPRLSGQGEMLSRLGGGIGTRGPGRRSSRPTAAIFAAALMTLRRNCGASPSTVGATASAGKKTKRFKWRSSAIQTPANQRFSIG